MGLLLLRVAIGSTIVIQAGACFAGENWSLLPCLTAVVALIGGSFLIAGFLTPVASAVAGIFAAGASLLPLPSPNLFEAALPAFLVVVVAVAIILLGPGAWSVDGRLFGRREIIIPHAPRSKKA